MYNDDGCEIFFSNLRCTTKKGAKQILKNLSGKFMPSSLIALMGSSGAGKTTLLNTLSAYSKQHNTSYDNLQLNGNETNVDDLATISCYLTQDIHLNDTLSVEENMHYAADFKLGETHSSKQRAKLIDDLLDSFGLTSTRQTRAGKLSGGEGKRLALALEMISDPKIIFLDEPTTGLDITTAHQILTYLKKIASSGKTVICTIHQVCASHFEIFDQVYAIVDGQCAYQGRPQDLVSFLNHHKLPCNIYHNPADYLIELCSGDFGDDKANYLVKASQNGRLYINSMPSDKIKRQSSSHTKTTWWYQFKTLLAREFVKTKRNWFLTYLRLLGSNFIGFLIGILYYNIGADGSKVFFIYNLLLCINANLLLTGLLYPILTFPIEMNIVKRETYNKYYTILQYYITVSILDLPISLLSIVSSNLLIYYLTGQPLEMNRVVLFIVFCASLGTTVNAIGFFYGTLLDLHNAIFFGSCTQVPFLTLSGFGIMPQDLPAFVQTISKYLYLRHGVQGCLVSVFGLEPRRLHCPEEADFCFYSQTHQFLKEIMIDPDEIVASLYVIAGWYIFVRIVTYFTMKYRLSVII